MPNISINLNPPLYQKQENAIFDPNRYVFIEASTKSGKTLGCLHWIISRASLKGNGANYWWIAPVFKQARIAYLRLKRGLIPYKSYGFEFKDADQKVIFPNGAIISCLSGDDPDNLYGEDVQDAVVDEASRVKEESYHAIRSTLTATKGNLRFIGNVKGKGNWFYKLSRLAESGELSNASYYKLTAYDAAEAGVIEYSEIEDAKKTLPESVFNELYLAEASDDGGNPFGLDSIKNCISPLSDEKPIVFGLDLAKHVDYTVLIGLDREGRVSHFSRWKANWETTIARVKQITKNTKVLADATGVGDPIVEMLRKPEGEFSGSNVEEFKFTQQSKQQIMEGLSVAIQKQLIRYPNNEIVKELSIFEYEKTRTGVRYTAPVGYHDDCVCALGLAWRGFNTLTLINVNECSYQKMHGCRESVSGWDKGLDSEFGIFEENDLSGIINQINSPTNWIV